ncbi:hypothetical protein [Synechococcus sp. UW179A]|uniref:hypothetical protein n=1 Tax=Synechococcus sp. UW179A TaxID=2575510 RepID=UPI000E0E0BF2|nr:hypothetical protein [Synechococcus sp. UW179A]
MLTFDPVDVVVIGAGGDIGSLLTTYHLQHEVLPPTERFQLVTNDHDKRDSTLYGLRIDLLDAFEERAPDIDGAQRPEDVVGDVIVVVGGETVTKKTTNRDEFARTNLNVLLNTPRRLQKRGRAKADPHSLLRILPRLLRTD